MANWVNVKEAADHLKMHPQTIYKAIKDQDELGSLFRKIVGTNRWRVDLDSLEGAIWDGTEVLDLRQKRAIKAYVLKTLLDMGEDNIDGAIKCMVKFEEVEHVNSEWINNYNEINSSDFMYADEDVEWAI